MKKLAVFVVFGVFPWEVFAGGFEFPSNGAVALGRGGAFVVRADDLVAVELNPSGLLKILGGSQIYLGNNSSSHNVTFTGFDALGNKVAPVSNESALQWFAPFIGIAYAPPGIKKLWLAVSVFGPSGHGLLKLPEDSFPKPANPNKPAAGEMSKAPHCQWVETGTDPLGNPTFGTSCRPHHYLLTDMETLLAFYTLSAAYGDWDRWGVGLSLHWVDLINAKFGMVVNGEYPPLKPKEDQAFTSYDVRADIEVKDRTGFAATAGAFYRPVRWLELGGSVRAPAIHFDAEGNTKLTFKGETIGNLYNSGLESGGKEGLVAFDSGGRATSRLPTKFSFAYPVTVRAGARYIHEVGEKESTRELFDLEFDVVWEEWSIVKSYDVKVDGYMQLVGSGVSETDENKKLQFFPVKIKKGYVDTMSYRVGGQVSAVDWATIHLGGYYETGSVPKAYTNVDFTSFDRYAASCGLSLHTSSLRFTVSYAHIFQADRVVTPEETKVYKQFPMQRSEITDDWARVGAGTFETSYDVFSTAVTWSF